MDKNSAIDETRAVLSETAQTLSDLRQSAHQNSCAHPSYSFGHPGKNDCQACLAGICMKKFCTTCRKEL